MNKFAYTIMTVAAGSALMLSACTSPSHMDSRNNSATRSGVVQDRTAGTVIDDAGITAGIKARYVDDRQVNAWDINVDTYDGVVTLYGSVPTKAAEQRAIDIARSVQGVRKVVSQITIVPLRK